MSLKEVPAAKQVVMRLIYVSCKQGGGGGGEDNVKPKPV